MGAYYGSCGTKVRWLLNQGTLTISGTGAMRNYTSDSGAPWEARKNSITAVVVEEGVTSIGDYAFNGYGNLTTVTLPGSVKTLGAYSFNYCGNLSEINFPGGLKTIGSCAFYSCRKLSAVNLPDTLTTIRSSAFDDCDALTEVVVPDQVTTHKNYAQGTADLDKPGYSLTIDEQDATTPLTEINTAVSEVYLGVIIGNKTEADLDALLAQVKNMGIDKVVDAYQSGYERFMSR